MVEETTMSYARFWTEILQHRTEMYRLLANINNVVICISLYDVNYGELPEGNSPSLQKRFRKETRANPVDMTIKRCTAELGDHIECVFRLRPGRLS
jgi:hypothetical protein